MRKTGESSFSIFDFPARFSVQKQPFSKNWHWQFREVYYAEMGIHVDERV